MSGALDDITVIDTTTAFWASIGVGLLADFGARTIKLEPRDASRPAADDAAARSLFELSNRNKRSLALDLTSDGGRRIFEAVIAKADVFVTDTAADAIAESGIGYERLASVRPDLIYVRASGFGPRGPDRELPALDELAAARTGLMPVLPQPDQPPVYTGAGQMYSAVMLALGVMLALQHRRATGEGQEVDVSLFAGNMYGASLDVQAFLAIGGERFLQPVSRLDAGNPMSGTLYPTSDGLWVTLTMPETDRWWPGLAEIVGLDAADERFDSHEKRCGAHRLELISALEEAFAKQPATHWRHVFNERQMSADVIEDYAYPANDKQCYGNEFIIERKGAKSLGFPLFMSETRARIERGAPGAGEQTDEVLREMLGMSDGEIAGLRRDKVVS
jgi:formyl-CoA transferase